MECRPVRAVTTLDPEFEHAVLDQKMNEELKALGYVN